MDLYDTTASLLAKNLTEKYSTSFSTAATLFDNSVRDDIYDIYGLVRIADEIVDSYDGQGQADLLNDLEAETYAAIKRGFSTNPIVHAFTRTARAFDIDHELIGPFFASMREDLVIQTFTTETLVQYIYGSAEVVGLMCLKVFCAGNSTLYEELAPGARRLGAAYQKVNFLRDIADDYKQLGRFYFVGTTFEELDEAGKRLIIADIRSDFDAAAPYITALPSNARRAVTLSYRYYNALLNTLDTLPIDTVKRQRVRIGGLKKLWLYIRVRFNPGL